MGEQVILSILQQQISDMFAELHKDNDKMGTGACFAWKQELGCGEWFQRADIVILQLHYHETVHGFRKPGYCGILVVSTDKTQVIIL